MFLEFSKFMIGRAGNMAKNKKRGSPLFSKHDFSLHFIEPQKWPVEGPSGAQLPLLPQCQRSSVWPTGWWRGSTGTPSLRNTALHVFLSVLRCGRWRLGHIILNGGQILGEERWERAKRTSTGEEGIPFYSSANCLGCTCPSRAKGRRFVALVLCRSWVHSPVICVSSL